MAQIWANLFGLTSSNSVQGSPKETPQPLHAEPVETSQSLLAEAMSQCSAEEIMNALESQSDDLKNELVSMMDSKVGSLMQHMGIHNWQRFVNSVNSFEDRRKEVDDALNQAVDESQDEELPGEEEGQIDENVERDENEGTDENIDVDINVDMVDVGVTATDATALPGQTTQKRAHSPEPDDSRKKQATGQNSQHIAIPIEEDEEESDDRPNITAVLDEASEMAAPTPASTQNREQIAANSTKLTEDEKWLMFLKQDARRFPWKEVVKRYAEKTGTEPKNERTLQAQYKRLQRKIQGLSAEEDEEADGEDERWQTFLEKNRGDGDSQQEIFLMFLKEDLGLPWKEIAQRYAEKFGKTKTTDALQTQYKRFKERTQKETQAAGAHIAAQVQTVRHGNAGSIRPSGRILTTTTHPALDGARQEEFQNDGQDSPRRPEPRGGPVVAGLAIPKAHGAFSERTQRDISSVFERPNRRSAMPSMLAENSSPTALESTMSRRLGQENHGINFLQTPVSTQEAPSAVLAARHNEQATDVPPSSSPAVFASNRRVFSPADRLGDLDSGDEDDADHNDNSWTNVEENQVEENTAELQEQIHAPQAPLAANPPECDSCHRHGLRCRYTRVGGAARDICDRCHSTKTKCEYSGAVARSDEDSEVLTPAEVLAMAHLAKPAGCDSCHSQGLRCRRRRAGYAAGDICDRCHSNKTQCVYSGARVRHYRNRLPESQISRAILTNASSLDTMSDHSAVMTAVEERSSAPSETWPAEEPSSMYELCSSIFKKTYLGRGTPAQQHAKIDSLVNAMEQVKTDLAFDAIVERFLGNLQVFVNIDTSNTLDGTEEAVVLSKLALGNRHATWGMEQQTMSYIFLCRYIEKHEKGEDFDALKEEMRFQDWKNNAGQKAVSTSQVRQRNHKEMVKMDRYDKLIELHLKRNPLEIPNKEAIRAKWQGLKRQGKKILVRLNALELEDQIGLLLLFPKSYSIGLEGRFGTWSVPHFECFKKIWNELEDLPKIRALAIEVTGWCQELMDGTKTGTGCLAMTKACLKRIEEEYPTGSTEARSQTSAEPARRLRIAPTAPGSISKSPIPAVIASAGDIQRQMMTQGRNAARNIALAKGAEREESGLLRERAVSSTHRGDDADDGENDENEGEESEWSQSEIDEQY